MPPDALLVTIAAWTGLVVGSFLNVVIWRLPRGESLVRPRSRCPGCERAIRWYENVPVLSWVALLGRCRGCRRRIAVRYPLVELLTGALFVAAWLAWRDEPATAALVALHLAALVAVTFIDWDHKIIPDVISKPGLVLGLALAPWMALPDRPRPFLAGARPALDAWLVALAGAAVGAGILLLIRWIGSALKKREAMGLGDVKLLAWIGALVGPVYVLVALVLGCIAGSVIGGAIYLIGRLRPLPCEARVTVGGTVLTADRLRIEDGALVLAAAEQAVVGAPATVHLRLSAVRVLEDDDVVIERPARLLAVEPRGGAYIWRIGLEGLTDAEDEHLFVFRHSNRYVPFGPFLALGGAACLLAPAWIWWLVTDAYPSWVRGSGPA